MCRVHARAVFALLLIITAYCACTAGRRAAALRLQGLAAWQLRVRQLGPGSGGSALQLGGHFVHKWPHLKNVSTSMFSALLVLASNFPLTQCSLMHAGNSHVGQAKDTRSLAPFPTRGGSCHTLCSRSKCLGACMGHYHSTGTSLETCGN